MPIKTQNRDKHEATNVLVLLSGGIDSTACTHFFLQQKFNVEALFIDYGQISAKIEARTAKEIARQLDVPFRNIRHIGACPKMAGEIQGRNACLLLTGLMEFQRQSGIIGIGLHAGTHYYDCSREFVLQMQEIFDRYTDGCVQVGAPFIEWSKLDVWDYTKRANLPTNLTYSCELGLQQPCGKCRSCKDLEALNAC